MASLEAKQSVFHRNLSGSDEGRRFELRAWTTNVSFMFPLTAAVYDGSDQKEGSANHG